MKEEKGEYRKKEAGREGVIKFPVMVVSCTESSGTMKVYEFMKSTCFSGTGKLLSELRRNSPDIVCRWQK